MTHEAILRNTTSVFRHLAVGALICVSAGISPAMAQNQVTSLPIADGSPCPVTIGGTERFALNIIYSVNPAAGSAATSKSSAILGEMSQLDRLKQEQAALVPTDSSVKSAAFSTAIGTYSTFVTAPVTGPDLTSTETTDSQIACVKSDIARSEVAPYRPTLNSDSIFGSRSLTISKTPFDAKWHKVAALSATTMLRRVVKSVGAKGKSSQRTKVELINNWVNAKVHYVDDIALYHRPDYWATASETLRRGAGDCEDYAIAKMQLLTAAGIAPEKMRLVVARDLIRNADHAVLVVDIDGDWLVLDNNTNRLVDARSPQDYRPIMSFSSGKRWLHGYAVADNRATVAHTAITRGTEVPALAAVAFATNVPSVLPTAP